MARPLPKPEPDDDTASYNPFRIALAIPRKCLLYLFPPATTLRIASHLVPLFVCLSFIPLVLFFSIFSGWHIWKNAPVAWQAPIYLQYGDGSSPYAELSLPPLSAVQSYDVSLQLVLPVSEANFALGNFMTTLSLSSPSNTSLVTVSRPSIVLPPKRSIFSFTTVPQLISLDIPLLSSYVPGTSNINARIDLGRRDGWKSLGSGEGRELSVWNAVLKGAVRLRGVWGLLSRFPLVFALVASATFFSLSITILAACILPALHWRVSMDETPPTSDLREDRPVRARKRSRRHVAGDRVSSTIYKSEDVPVDIPSRLTSDDLPLKRRRSRMSDTFVDSEN